MKLRFEFQYDTKPNKRGIRTDKHLHPFGCTAQIIDDEGFVLGEGSSLCHPLDQFNKKTGKKLALQRAIDSTNGTLTYEERRALWSKLFQQ